MSIDTKVRERENHEFPGFFFNQKLKCIIRYSKIFESFFSRSF